MLLDVMRMRFTDAGYTISPRDDVDSRAAAWFLGKSEKTLANWRSEKRGPAYASMKY